jgi:phosphate transport system protein
LRPFELELESLNQQLLEMGALVASSVHRSVLSLTEKSEDLAHQVLRDEARIDAMEMQIDDFTSRIMARNQPVARDMRLVIAAIKITTDLERMGDLAANIVERSLSLMHQPPLDANIDIGRLCSMVENMVMGVLDSFVKQDSDAAAQIMSADDAVDQLRNEISKELLNCMQNDPSSIVKALDMLFIARGLERIADHATNIAEDVIFLVQGIDVRHQTEASGSSQLR